MCGQLNCAPLHDRGSFLLDSVNCIKSLPLLWRTRKLWPLNWLENWHIDTLKVIWKHAIPNPGDSSVRFLFLSIFFFFKTPSPFPDKTVVSSWRVTAKVSTDRALWWVPLHTLTPSANVREDRELNSTQKEKMQDFKYKDVEYWDCCYINHQTQK